MTDVATRAVPDAEQAMAVLSSIPAAPASLLALASRIAALEQTLSYEAASSPPVHIGLPLLTLHTQPATNTPASSSSSLAASTSASRRLTASTSLSSLTSPTAAAHSTTAATTTTAQQPSLSFLQKVSELHSTLQSLEDDTTSHFFALHASYEQLLSSSASLSQFLHSAAAKQQILLSQHTAITQRHTQLTTLTQLLPAITPPQLGVSSAEVSAVERGVRERAAECARLHVAVDRFVCVWDSCVDALNGMLVAMDARMGRWEQQVDRIAQQRQTQAV